MTDAPSGAASTAVVVVDAGHGLRHRVPVTDVAVGGAAGVFTGAGTVEDGAVDPGPGRPGNLAHRRPHRPAVLAATRRAVLEHVGATPAGTTWMHQVHGSDVGLAPAGDGPHELRGVDGLVAVASPGAPPPALVVQVADCVPVLLSSRDGTVVGVAHAGRRGVETGVVDAVVDALAGHGGGQLHAVVGPAICGRCYEVPEELRDEVADAHPAAASTTSWGTPALDLPAAVLARLDARDVAHERVDACTLHDDGWFSHRGDPATGRQVGVVVARAVPA